jgi:quinol monooxygenase YgiN
VVLGKPLPGKDGEALRVVSEQVERVHRTTGLSMAQVLQGEDELIVISAWRTAKDLRAYADSKLAQDFIERLTPLLVAPPQVKSLEIKLALEGSEPLFAPDEGGEG